MEVNELHGYDLSPSEARNLQTELAPRISVEPDLDLDSINFVAGADVSTEAGANMAYATVVVLEFPGLTVVEEGGEEKGSVSDLVDRGEVIGKVVKAPSSLFWRTRQNKLDGDDEGSA